MKTKTTKKSMKRVSKSANKTKPDVVNKHVGGSWAYSEEVRSHFFAPRNLLWENPKEAVYDAEGVVGSPACGKCLRGMF